MRFSLGWNKKKGPFFSEVVFIVLLGTVSWQLFRGTSNVIIVQMIMITMW